MADIIQTGGTYTVTSGGTYFPVILNGVTFIDSGYKITLEDPLALDTTFEASNGGIINFGGKASVSLLDTFDIGNTGTIEFGSSIGISVGSAFDFTNISGTHAELVFGSSINFDIGSPGISGWKAGSEIDLSGQTITGTSWSQSTGLLTVTTTTGTDVLAFQGSYTNANFTHSGSDIQFACFARGTRIDCPDGQMPVESLAAGDRISVASGDARAVKWIGYRTLDLTCYGDTRIAHPVRIASGAFGDALPRRDLLVSPDHALLVDGLLIPARMLVNGMTIRRETQCRSVTYYHLELETHDVVLAEGLPAESYLDTGNRAIFENHDGAIAMRPDFADVVEARRRSLGCCRPFAIDEERVKPIWKRLVQRAQSLGHSAPADELTTADPGLFLAAGGRRIPPIGAAGGRYVFLLPAAGGTISIVSRSTVPADARPWVDDRRRLGVMVRQMTMRLGNRHLTIPADHPMLNEGWWDVELAAGAPGRWTNGDAVIGSLPGGAVLTVELAAQSESYSVENEGISRAAA